MQVATELSFLFIIHYLGVLSLAW